MDYRKVCQQIVKYLISGMTVAFAAFFIPRRQMNLEEIIMISFTAAVSFAVLEHYAPSLYQPSLFGSGFGIGANNVGFEGFITQHLPANDVRENYPKHKCMKWKPYEKTPKAVDCKLNEFF